MKKIFILFISMLFLTGCTCYNKDVVVPEHKQCVYQTYNYAMGKNWMLFPICLKYETIKEHTESQRTCEININ